MFTKLSIRIVLSSAFIGVLLMLSAQPSQGQGTPPATAAATTTAPKKIFFTLGSDKVCELYMADEDGQNAGCIVQGLFDNMVATVQKAAKIDPQDQNYEFNRFIRSVDSSAQADKLILNLFVFIEKKTSQTSNSTSYSNVGTAYRTYLFDVASSTPTLLGDINSMAGQMGLLAAAISPDGSKVVYTKAGEKNKPSPVYYDALDGKPAVALVLPASLYMDMSWSPDGKQVVAVNQSNLLTVDPTAPNAKGTVLPVKPTMRFIIGLSWSPDGKQLLYATSAAAGSQNYGFFRYSFADKKSNTLLPAKIFSYPFTKGVWSPNGSLILVQGYQPTANGKGNSTHPLMVIHADGTVLQTIVPDTTGSGFGFTSDAQHVVYSASNPDTHKTGIFVSDLAGQNPTLLIEDAFIRGVQP